MEFKNKEKYVYRMMTSNETILIKDILVALPDYFGLEESLNNYVKDSASLDVIGCFSEDTCIGFLSLKPTSKAVLEVYVMGIDPTYHHQGIGSKLLQLAMLLAKEKQYSYMQVKTLDPSIKDKNYLKTYAFYKAMGFVDVEVLPLWDEWNPCLLMIQKL